MRRPNHRTAASLQVEPWELALARYVASEFPRSEKDELTAELAASIADLKIRRLPQIRNWKAYLRTALRNKARNWVRDRKRRDYVPLLGPEDEDFSESFVSQANLGTSEDLDLRVGLNLILDGLNSKLRDVWFALAEENGNQAAVARRLGMHRNTVRQHVLRIRRILDRQGLPGEKYPSHNTVTPLRRRDLRALETRRRTAIRLFREGYSQIDVSRKLNVARQTVNRWVQRYRAQGEQGLAMASRAGRKPRLTSAQVNAIRQLIAPAPSMWTPRRLARYITDHLGVTYHPGHVWKLLRTLRPRGG